MQISHLKNFYPPLSQLQITEAATDVSTCRSIIDSMGYNATSPFEDSEAFVGGGCAYHMLNEGYQVMNQEVLDPTCEASPEAGSEWQQVCACTR